MNQTDSWGDTDRDSLIMETDEKETQINRARDT